MIIISWNVNGIRAVYKKNFLRWFEETNPDIVCLQEIKAQEAQLSSLFGVNLFDPKSHHLYSNFAQKSGYSGVTVFTKTRPIVIERKLGIERFDREGRMLVLKYPDFTLINIYLPHGGRMKENLEYKLEAYQNLLEYLRRFQNKNVILAGDFNVAHTEIDLARPKNNQNNTMFTPEERKQLDKIIGLGFVDSFRKFHPEEGHYTWWSYAVNARERNLGWRIDYIFVSKNLAPKLKDAFIFPEVHDSDHCPIRIDI